MTRRGVTVTFLCALVVLAIATSAWRVMAVARGAMAEQVRTAEELAASERALALGDALRSASARLEQLGARAGRLAALAEEVQVSLALEILMAQPGAVGAGVVGSAGEVIAGEGDLGEIPPGDSPVFRPATADRGATVVLRAPVRLPQVDGVAAHIVQVLLLGDLVTGFERPFAALEGATSLVQRSGVLIMSTADNVPPKVQSRPMLELIATGKPGYLEYWSPRFQSDRVGVTHPVPGTDLVVVVSADARTVAAPASALVRDLALVLVVTALVTGGLVAALAHLDRRLRRQLANAAALAMVDPLTGLTNRRGLDALANDIEDAAVVAVDLDHLKVLNDTFGHASGDRAIVLVAEALRAAVRDDDIVARVGGDEFIVVMPGADRSRAQAVVRSVERALAADDVSVSAGLAMARAADLAGALVRADQDLYAAKRGREPLSLV